MPVTNARVTFPVALSLLAFLSSPSLQDRAWTSDGYDHETIVNSSPGYSKWKENNDFSGPPGHNKWGGGGRGPPGGHGPPGLTGGSPPGLSDKRPSNWNTGYLSEENHPNNNEPGQRRPTSWNNAGSQSSSTNERYPSNYPNESTERRSFDWNNARSQSSSTTERYPYNYPNNESTERRSSGRNDARSQSSSTSERYSTNDEFNEKRSSSSSNVGNRTSFTTERYTPNYSSNNESNQRRPSTRINENDQESSDREDYPRTYPTDNKPIQRRPTNQNNENDQNSSDRGDHSSTRTYPSNNESTQRRLSNKGTNTNLSEREDYPRNSNNDRSTQTLQSDYDREGSRDPNDRVPDDRGSNNRNDYSRNQQCRDNEFRCGSNECLPQRLKCDDRIDCRDGSDEESCIANRNKENDCALPEQPAGGHYELSDCRRCNKRPGDMVPKNSILNFTCKDNYILSGNTISVCVDGEWYQPPSCNKICPPLNSTSVDISCSYQEKTVSCSERIMPGTRATLACKSSYKLPLTNDPAYREITCLDDGLWDRPLFRCLPECGSSIAHGNTLIVNGFQAKAGVFPWHVGVYVVKRRRVEYEQICGGSLISNNLVVSAAHCFYDESYNKLYEASKYAVAAGKHHRDWNAQEEYAQQSLVESIQAGGRYQGARGNFANDIALLKLKTPFELTALVKPVCIDWDNTHEREQLQVGHTGKVVGWGKDIKGESTKRLQEINMPFVPYDQCVSAVPADFRGYLTSDKFCAGYKNGSSVCDGDSGGGLCFEKDGVWYLRGIVSVSPENRGTCDYNSYVGFTYLSHFRDWVREAYVNSTT